MESAFSYPAEHRYLDRPLLQHSLYKARRWAFAGQQLMQSRVYRQLLLRHCKVIGLPVDPREDDFFLNWISDFKLLNSGLDVIAIPANVTCSGDVHTTYNKSAIFGSATKSINQHSDGTGKNADSFSEARALIDIISVSASKLQYEPDRGLLSHMGFGFLELAPDALRVRLIRFAKRS